MTYPDGGPSEAVQAAAGGVEAVLLVGRELQAQIERLSAVVARQDRAIDQALELIYRLSTTGSVTRAFREHTERELLLALNESLDVGVTPAGLRHEYRVQLRRAAEAAQTRVEPTSGGPGPGQLEFGS